MLTIHLHLYQPPREDPWLEVVLPEPSAAPFRHWNERISRECYEPNAEGGNFRWVNFDVGPPLLEWLRRNRPAVYAELLAADRAGLERWGWGNALAHPYYHAILPLLPRRDREVLVRWGIEHFRRHFGRAPEGMWLPEMAVDLETLEVLADSGISYTVLTQAQVRGRPQGGPYKAVLPSGRSVAVFVRDEAASNALAFGTADQFEARLSEAGDLVVALDGETFGHHRRDLQLSTLLERHRDRLVNMGARLEKGYRGEVEVVPHTSWSCPHGLGRWSRDCGCDGPAPWREALRGLVDWVGRQVDEAYLREVGDWGPVVRYIETLMGGPRPQDPRLARLLEAQRAKLAANTSDAWFFARLGIEAGISLRWALRALELLEDEGLVEEFYRRLSSIAGAAPLCPRLRGPLMAVAMYLASAASGREAVGPYVIRPINDEVEVEDTRTGQTWRFRQDLLWMASG